MWLMLFCVLGIAWFVTDILIQLWYRGVDQDDGEPWP